MKRFTNRETAGDELSEKLMSYKNSASIVLAVPRGGVPVGFVVSQKLDCPLGLVWVKKIGHPLNPELAIGAVSPDDLNVEYKSSASDLYIHTEVKKIRSRFIEMNNTIKDPTTNIDFKNKILILVDDGIATGHTLMAAIQLLRKKMPAKIIVAAPVAPLDSIRKLKKLADEVVVIYTPEFFTGISSFYTDFSQLNDEEVALYMNKAQMSRRNHL